MCTLLTSHDKAELSKGDQGRKKKGQGVSQTPIGHVRDTKNPIAQTIRGVEASSVSHSPLQRYRDNNGAQGILRDNQTYAELRATISRHLLPPIFPLGANSGFIQEIL